MVNNNTCRVLKILFQTFRLSFFLLTWDFLSYGKVPLNFEQTFDSQNFSQFSSSSQNGSDFLKLFFLSVSNVSPNIFELKLQHLN